MKEDKAVSKGEGNDPAGLSTRSAGDFVMKRACTSGAVPGRPCLLAVMPTALSWVQAVIVSLPGNSDGPVTDLPVSTLAFSKVSVPQIQIGPHVGCDKMHYI